MKKSAGFTLLEIMVVIAILGILGASAVAFQTKYRERTTRSEADIMMKQILEGEIMYFLEHDEFFPKEGNPELWVWNDGRLNSETNKEQILAAINVAIPIGHRLDFRIYFHKEYIVDKWFDRCVVEITALPGSNVFLNNTGLRGTAYEEKGTIIELF